MGVSIEGTRALCVVERRVGDEKILNEKTKSRVRNKSNHSTKQLQFP